MNDPALDGEFVLGVDPGLATTGWAVLGSTPLRLCDHGTITTTTEFVLAERLLQIYSRLNEVLSKHSVSIAAVEGLFYRPGLAKTALLLGHARGTLLLTLANAGIKVVEYPASEVRKALGVSGRADKDRVKRMIDAILGTSVPGPDHIWDATALAICHILRSRNPLMEASKS